ncbi:M50 family metallopeptidase [uncultured Erythrobacter sp.]|uniref:M50 family metallopeptidase n=1 Tax=uncultured Erythrobacter sp. TaxID=263913 RepID=UPI00260626C5|nr:M50 family metallopeptidase [uncultured Erythrobacter sp.]
MRSMVTPGSQAEEVGRLILAGFIVIALPSLPFGSYLVYPFAILTTWFHEMGHGLTALAMGQSFDRLLIYANGSGLAESRVATDASPFLRAAIAAGGPLAPTFFGAGLIVASAHQRAWRPVLWGTSIAIFASVILYVRTTVGFAVLPLIALALALIAWKASPGINRFTLQFLGVLGAMSMLSDYRYFFTEQVVIDGKPILSDTGQIEAALWFPHWFWAALILLISATMVGASLKYALSDRRRIGAIPKRPANVLQFKRTSDRDH